MKAITVSKMSAAPPKNETRAAFRTGDNLHCWFILLSPSTVFPGPADIWGVRSRALFAECLYAPWPSPKISNSANMSTGTIVSASPKSCFTPGLGCCGDPQESQSPQAKEDKDKMFFDLTGVILKGLIQSPSMIDQAPFGKSTVPVPMISWSSYL